jgi:ankyrin repeat protein
MERTDGIIAAVKAKDLGQVESLLTADPTLIDTQTPDGSLILTAAYNGARDVIPVLLRHGAKLDIFEAATVGDAERIRALLAANPELVHAANGTGFEPLHLAAFFGNAAAAKALLENGADVNRVMGSKVRFVPSNTALHAAIAGGPHREVVALLVVAGADLDLVDSNKQSPLHAATFHDDLEVIAYLIQHGADVNRQAEGGPTPLAYALAHGKEAQAALIRAAGGAE